MGDTEDDMVMARNSESLGGLGVTTGLCNEGVLKKHTDHVYTNLKELALVFN